MSLSSNSNSEFQQNKNFSVEIDLYYSYFSILNHDNTNCITNFWKAHKKNNIKQSFIFDYKLGNNMMKPELIKEYLIQQSSFISNLSLENTCLLVSNLTTTSVFIKNYIQYISTLQSYIEVNEDRNTAAEPRHAITPLYIFKSLWILLYEIFKEDDTFDKLYDFETYMNFLQEKENENLEYLVTIFTSKECKLSQIRFLGLELERKLVTNYLNKINDLIYETNSSNFKIFLFQSIDKKELDEYKYLFYSDDQLYYLKYFYHFSLQQINLYYPQTNIDDFQSQEININTKAKYYLFPDSNIVKNLKVTDRGVYSISTPKASLDTTNLILKFAKKHSIQLSTIIDGTAGLGGNVYHFMTVFKNVIAVEKDKITYEALLYNCNLYKKLLPNKYKANIFIINGSIVSDFSEIVKNSNNLIIDAIFMSPPWGGLNYKTAKNVTYYLDNKPLWDVSKYLLNYTSLLYLDVGKNININEFLKNMNPNENNYIIDVIERTNYAYLICIYNSSKSIKKKNIYDSINHDLQLSTIFDKNSFNNNNQIEENEIPVFVDKGSHSICLDLLLSPKDKKQKNGINNIILPLSTVYKKVTTLHYKPFKYIVDVENMKPFPSKEEMFSKFADYFKTDLLYWRNDNRKPHWIVKGGFGIRQLLGHKYKESNLVNSIKTKDIDLNVSIKDKEFRKKYIDYLYKKVYSFFNSTSYYFLFRTQLLLFNTPFYNRIERNNLHALLLIRYQNADWIDIGFVDFNIYPSMIDWSISYKVGFPIKTSEYYMEEILKLVYQSSVKDVDSYTYKKRNPIRGSLFKKGIQDIERSKILCELDAAIYEEYDIYCDYVSTLSKKEIQSGNINFDFLHQYFNRKIKQLN
jgi:hypothetical protein